MTREEILLQSIWTSGKMSVYSDFFQKEVLLHLFTSEYTLSKTSRIISDKFVACVHDFLSLSEEYKPLMQELLYKHCLECCENISYGLDILEEENEAQAKLRKFGVSGPLSAWEKAQLHHGIIEEDTLRKNRFVQIVFYPEWENEHGCVFVLKNGVLLDFYGEPGLYLGQFDD